MSSAAAPTTSSAKENICHICFENQPCAGALRCHHSLYQGQDEEFFFGTCSQTCTTNASCAAVTLGETPTTCVPLVDGDGNPTAQKVSTPP